MRAPSSGACTRFCGDWLDCNGRSHGIACFELRSDFRFGLAFPFFRLGEPKETSGRIAHCERVFLACVIEARKIIGPPFIAQNITASLRRAGRAPPCRLAPSRREETRNFCLPHASLSLPDQGEQP